MVSPCLAVTKNGSVIERVRLHVIIVIVMQKTDRLARRATLQALCGVRPSASLTIRGEGCLEPLLQPLGPLRFFGHGAGTRVTKYVGKFEQCEESPTASAPSSHRTL